MCIAFFIGRKAVKVKQTKLSNVKIRGIICAVPRNNVDNKAFETVFSPEDIEKSANMTGVRIRRIAEGSICTSDLCTAAAHKLMEDLSWEPETIDGIIFVSQTPDHRLPATSCIIQERLGLSNECAAFDVNLGCSGYVYGLWMASNLIAASALRRVLLLVGDTITKVITPDDKSTAMLFGDAGSATALEYDESATKISFVLGTDGKGKDNLIINAGGFRNPTTTENLARNVDPEKGTYSDNYLYMNGGEIFNFTIKRVPALVKDLLSISDFETKDVDYFVFHQANEFILKHLSRKIKLDQEKCPMNIGKFGNTSSASIPLVIVSELADVLSSNTKKLAMLGFGVGYSWGGVLIDVGPLLSLGLLEV